MNLELVDTMELVDELAKRFETCVITGLKAPMTHTDEAPSPMLWKYKGGALQALGMCHMVSVFIAHDIGLTHLTKDDI